MAVESVTKGDLAQAVTESASSPATRNEIFVSLHLLFRQIDPRQVRCTTKNNPCMLVFVGRHVIVCFDNMPHKIGLFLNEIGKPVFYDFRARNHFPYGCTAGLALNFLRARY